MHLSKVAFCTLAVVAARELPQTAAAAPNPEDLSDRSEASPSIDERSPTQMSPSTAAVIPPDRSAGVDWAVEPPRAPHQFQLATEQHDSAAATSASHASTSTSDANVAQWDVNKHVRQDVTSQPATESRAEIVADAETEADANALNLSRETPERNQSEAERDVSEVPLDAGPSVEWSNQEQSSSAGADAAAHEAVELYLADRSADRSEAVAGDRSVESEPVLPTVQVADQSASRLEYGLTPIALKQHPSNRARPQATAYSAQTPQNSIHAAHNAADLPTVSIRSAGNGDRPAQAQSGNFVQAGSQLQSVSQPIAQLPRISQVRRTTFPDVQGHWAQDFIEALAERDVVSGFPDGFFRPDDRLTRAQFAAMIQQAFRQPPVQQTPDFADVPSDYWAANAIDESYRMGFFNGYSSDVFNPEQNISRVETLVALTTGLDLQATEVSSSDVNALFSDASQIPDYADQAVAEAVEYQLVVNYPNLNRLRPSQPSTRAEAAAAIHQALVNRGLLPPLTTAAARYIVGYEIDEPPVTEERLRDRFRIDDTSTVVSEVTSVGGERSPDNVGVPSVSLSTPTGFGADWRDIFFAAGFQERTRYSDRSDGAIGLGFGVGDAEDAVGLEVAFTVVDLAGEGAFEDGGVSFKLHRQFNGGWAIAAGVENFITFGETDGGSSGYGVVSKHFQFRDESEPFSSLTASLGVGGGRFRLEDDLDEDTVGVFGSVGIRLLEPVSLITEWTGQDLNVGLAIAPFRNFPLVITPGVADITGNAGDGARFILGIGAGYSF